MTDDQVLRDLADLCRVIDPGHDLTRAELIGRLRRMAHAEAPVLIWVAARDHTRRPCGGAA